MQEKETDLSHPQQYNSFPLSISFFIQSINCFMLPILQQVIARTLEDG